MEEMRKFDLPVNETDLKWIFERLLKAQLITEFEYRRCIDRVKIDGVQ